MTSDIRKTASLMHHDSDDVSDRSVDVNRREFMARGALLGAAAGAAGLGLHSGAARLMAALVIFSVFSESVSAQEAQTEAKLSASDVAHELANPNTSLGFMAFPMDYITYQGDLPNAGSQEAWKISFQPSLPYPIAKGTNFFLRPLIPVILKEPIFNGTGFDDSDTELGDISFDAAIGKSFSNGVQIIEA
jgi:hypothetical protein